MAHGPRRPPGARQNASYFCCPAGATQNSVLPLARPTPQDPACGPKLASDGISGRKKQLESNFKQAKERALVSAREAIGILRELEIEDETILKELGFRAERAPKKAANDKSGPRLEPARDW
jgi:hypothetical protein